MLKKIILSIVLLFGFPLFAFAHVVVNPSIVGVAKWQVFTVAVPSEKELSTTQVRVVLPEGLKHVTPTVKQGWVIDTVKQGEGESQVITEIIWKGGVVPAHQRDEFSFSVQVPASPTGLIWKAYQTYADGTTVAWDQDPNNKQPETDGKLDFSQVGPYSKTEVVNDLSVKTEAPKEKNTTPLTLSVIALALAIAALVKKQKTV